ncbi:uncharacterized protein LOC129588681 [Paramacrobiotus metropolitanus]|uniref:uncharacterized protein LOC129588681 n=1 Tax=Paramacrobiotus metropolitanus TaxID=2943436 RepID=UPI0024456467|nr:uncharacterized protein LOC129588681 [Paramacrobiotus metropolitanus]
MLVDGYIDSRRYIDTMEAIFCVGSVFTFVLILWMEFCSALNETAQILAVNTTQLTITLNADVPNNLTSARNISSSSCVGKNGFYPDPTKACAVYYLCSPDGSRVIFECPPGQRFDTADQACVNATLVQCAEEVNVIKPVTPASRKRLRAFGPENFAVTSTDFSDWKSVDHLALESDLSDQMQTVIPDDRPITTSIPYSNEYATQLQSRIGGIFSKTSSSPFVSPVASSSNTVNTVQRSPAGVFDCQNRRGYFPDVMQRCNSYYFCDGTGRALKFQCPLDLAFDQPSQACVYPHKAMCPFPQDDGSDFNNKQLNVANNQQQAGNMPSSSSFSVNNQIAGGQQTGSLLGNGQQGSVSYSYQSTPSGPTTGAQSLTGFPAGQGFQSVGGSATASGNTGTTAGFGNGFNQQSASGQQGSFQQGSFSQGPYTGGQSITSSPSVFSSPNSQQQIGNQVGSQQLQQPFPQQIGFPAGSPINVPNQQQNGVTAQQNQFTPNPQNVFNGGQQSFQSSSTGGYGYGQSQGITNAPGLGNFNRPGIGSTQPQQSFGGQQQLQTQQQAPAFSGGGSYGVPQGGGLPISGTTFQQIAPPALSTGIMQLAPGNSQQTSFGSQGQFSNSIPQQPSRPYQQPPTQPPFQQPLQSGGFQTPTQPAGQFQTPTQPGQFQSQQTQRPPFQQAQPNTFPTQQQTQQPSYATFGPAGGYGGGSPGPSQQIIQPQPTPSFTPPASPPPQVFTPGPIGPGLPTQPPFATLPGSSAYGGGNAQPTNPTAPGAGQTGRDEPPVSPPPAANTTTQVVPPMEGVALSVTAVTPTPANVTKSTQALTEAPVPSIPQIDASCNGLPRGFYPLPGCRKYFYCSTFGERLNYSCQTGKMWHPQRSLCEDEEKVVCPVPASKDNPFELQADDALGLPGQKEVICAGRIGNFPDTVSGCRRFYRCLPNGQIEKHHCAEGMLFSIQQDICMTRDLVKCGNHTAQTVTGETTGFTVTTSPFGTFPPVIPTNNPQTFCGQLPPGRYANLQDGCRSFWICDETGLDKVQSCPPGLLFDNTVQACDSPQNVDCTNRITNQPANDGETFIRQNSIKPFVTSTMVPQISNFNCAGQGGFFADLQADCRVYHYCGNDGKAFNFTCPSNYRYSEAKQACDVPELTPCETKFITPQGTFTFMTATGFTLPPSTFAMTSPTEMLPEASHLQPAVVDPAPEDTLQNRWFKFTESPFFNKADMSNEWHALRPFNVNDNLRMGRMMTRQGRPAVALLSQTSPTGTQSSIIQNLTAKAGNDRLKSSQRVRNHNNNFDFQQGFFEDQFQFQPPPRTPLPNEFFSQDNFTPFVRPHLREPGQLVVNAESTPFARPNFREPSQFVNMENNPNIPFIRPHLTEPGQLVNSGPNAFMRNPDPRLISPQNFFENQNFDSNLRTPLNGLPRPPVTDNSFPFNPPAQIPFPPANPISSGMNGPLVQLTPPTPFPPFNRQTEPESIFSQIQDTANPPTLPQQFTTGPFPGQFEHFNPNANFIAHTEFMKQQPMTTFPTPPPINPSFSFEDPASRLEPQFVQTPIITTVAPLQVEVLTPPPTTTTTTFRPLTRPIECPLGRMGYFADPLVECRRYIFCDGKGGRAEYTCPPGMAFNTSLVACDLEIFVHCEKPSELMPFSLTPTATPSIPTARNACFGRTTGYYADFTSGCREYFYCAPAGVSGFSEKMDFHCPADFLFDEYRGVCVENGQCMVVEKLAQDQLDAAASTNQGVSRLQERFPRQFDISWSHPNDANSQFTLPALPERQKDEAVIPCRENGKFADFDSGCIGFWNCESPFLFAKFVRCPPGNLFDPISKHCIASYLVQCLPAPDQPDKKGKTAKFSCFGRNAGFYADISDGCRKFHHCTVDGDIFSYTCPFDWIFNEKVGECVQPDNHTCPVFAISKYNDFDCFGKSGYYADFGQHCQVFHLCRLNGSRTTMSCPPAMVFDENEAKCVYGNMCVPPLPPAELFEQSLGGSPALPRIFECPLGSTGYFGDPLYGCRVYWQCVDGLKLQNRTCPGYLRFNASTEICERPNHVICLDPLMLELIFPGLIRGPFTPDLIPSAPTQQLVSDGFSGFPTAAFSPKSEVINGMKQFCEPGFYGYYAEVRSNCHTFFHCERDLTKKNYVCPGHMMFNETLVRCQEPGLSGCMSTRPRSLFPQNTDVQLDIGHAISGNMLCRNRVGLVADVATGCRHFLMCHLNGTFFNQSCPGGLLFNEKSSFCEWPFHVRCGDSITSQSGFGSNFAMPNGLTRETMPADLSLRFGSNLFTASAASPSARSIADTHGTVSDGFMSNKADPTVQFPATRTSSLHNVLEQVPTDPFSMANVKVGSAFFHPGDMAPETARSHPGVFVPQFRRHFPESMISSGSHSLDTFPMKPKNPGSQPFGPARPIIFENTGLYGPGRPKWFPHFTTAGTTTVATTTAAPTTTAAAAVEELEYEPEEGLMPGATTAAPAAVVTTAAAAPARAMPLIMDGLATAPPVLNDALTANTKPTEPHKTYGVDCYGKRGYFLSPGTGCKSYVFCKPSGALYGFTCPGEYLYNADKEICDWPENVLCLAASSHSVPQPPNQHWQRSAVDIAPRLRRSLPFTCPYGNAYFADVASNCLSFFYCSNNGTVSMYDCPDRQLKFDESRGVCDWGKRVKCANETEYTEATQSPVALEIYQEIVANPTTASSNTGCPSTGFYADYSTDCHGFYFCGPEGNRLNYSCPDGLVYDEIQEKCTNSTIVCKEHKLWKSYGKRVRLVTRTRLISANGESSLDCRNRRGLYADPRSRCFNFFYCSPQGLKFEYSCPENMAFNNALNVCDEPSNSSCSVLP